MKGSVHFEHLIVRPINKSGQLRVALQVGHLIVGMIISWQVELHIVSG